jgi:hypothetical protein
MDAYEYNVVTTKVKSMMVVATEKSTDRVSYAFNDKVKELTAQLGGEGWELISIFAVQPDVQTYGFAFRRLLR